MFIDALLLMSSAQALTVTAASTSYIDTLAAGDAYYPGARLIIHCTTTFAGQGATTLQASLQHDSDPGFGTATDLITVAAATEGAAGLTALSGAAVGYGVLFDGVLPFGCKRYLRMYYTIASGPMTAGALTARIVLNTDRTLDKVI